MAKLSGTLYKRGTIERVEYATLKAFRKGEKAVIVQTDDDGDFTFGNLSTGNWTIIALHENYMPGKKQVINIKEGQNNVDIYLDMVRGTHDQELGKKFFNRLILYFVVLVIIYLALHWYVPATITKTKSVFFWDTDPWRMLEILMWGFAGIVVNKLLFVSWYLYKKIFFIEGRVMHHAQLITTPVLVLVSVFILSLATIDLELASSSNKLSLDLSDANIMIAVAFLLGVAPWPLWNFVLGVSRKILGEIESEDE
ncbi:MAG: carboxypeptidase regulatory-like domain-containing protein [Candidatus Heimdallarchaeota archaeon]|nr:carboxypeptidase regulatory-like domain-containing protein [Candidatus Heimdallarchaeota archaeon]